MRKYPVQDVAKEINSNLSEHNYSWLRITGGEPFLNLERGRELCDVLRLIEENAASFKKNVVVQTNGLLFANQEKCSDIVGKLTDLSLDILIEVSLKGTCREEFSLLTQLPQNNYDTQLEAVNNLERAVDRKPNLAYRLIMGFGPNRVSKDLPSHLFVHPEKKRLLQVKEEWDPRFSQLHEKYLEESPSGHLGFSMACLVTRSWGFHPMRNLEKQGMLARRQDLSKREIEAYRNQWESIHPYFAEMNPEIFYALEFP